MLTPQDISEKGFVKAVFGGYDMAGVDDFLETVQTDYAALYKENAILKGKLKVLVEKVEEYRSTEDAMRMALLTAQRMGEEITIEAAKTKDDMIKSADDEVRIKYAEFSHKLSLEEARLAAASKETKKFIDLSYAILRKHTEFLKKLETATHIDGASSAASAKPVAAPIPIAPPPEQEQAAPPVAPTMPTPAPKSASRSAKSVAKQEPEVEIENIAEQIGNAVEQMTTVSAEAAPSVAPLASPVPLAPSDSAEQNSLFEKIGDTVELPTAEELSADISPRPKFDFDDLKFGANFDNDE